MSELESEKGKKALKTVFEISSLKIASLSNFRHFFHELRARKKYPYTPLFESLGREAINDLNFLMLELRDQDDNLAESIKCSILYLEWILKDFKTRRFTFESYV